MVVMTSFKSYGEANFLSIALPKEFLFQNYVDVFIQGKIMHAFFNSVIITVSSVTAIVILSAMLSYILMRNRNRTNRFIYKMMTFGIIAPFAALPTIQLLKSMHIYGTYISLVFVYAALFMPFSTMLFSGFILSVPKRT